MKTNIAHDRVWKIKLKTLQIKQFKSQSLFVFHEFNFNSLFTWFIQLNCVIVGLCYMLLSWFHRNHSSYCVMIFNVTIFILHMTDEKNHFNWMYAFVFKMFTEKDKKKEVLHIIKYNLSENYCDFNLLNWICFKWISINNFSQSIFEQFGNHLSILGNHRLRDKWKLLKKYR